MDHRGAELDAMVDELISRRALQPRLEDLGLADLWRPSRRGSV
jgi:hypothetical protein